MVWLTSKAPLPLLGDARTRRVGLGHRQGLLFFSAVKSEATSASLLALEKGNHGKKIVGVQYICRADSDAVDGQSHGPTVPGGGRLYAHTPAHRGADGHTDPPHADDDPGSSYSACTASGGDCCSYTYSYYPLAAGERRRRFDHPLGYHPDTGRGSHPDGMDGEAQKAKTSCYPVWHEYVSLKLAV